jgi:hypothetical protein
MFKKSFVAILWVIGLAIGTGGAFAADGGFAVPIALNSHTETKATQQAMADTSCFVIHAAKENTLALHDPGSGDIANFANTITFNPGMACLTPTEKTRTGAEVSQFRAATVKLTI